MLFYALPASMGRHDSDHTAEDHEEAVRENWDWVIFLAVQRYQEDPILVVRELFDVSAAVDGKNADLSIIQSACLMDKDTLAVLKVGQHAVAVDPDHKIRAAWDIVELDHLISSIFQKLTGTC
jgi:hypothetical protein